MRAELSTDGGVVGRDGAGEVGARPLYSGIYSADARRLQAETIARGVHWCWACGRSLLRRLIDGRAPAHAGAPSAASRAAGSAMHRPSVDVASTSAIRRGVLRLARGLRRSVLEPLARGRRRRSAIAQLRAMDDRLLADIGVARAEIELVVDGILSRPPSGRPDGWPDGPHPLAGESRPELPLAA